MNASWAKEKPGGYLQMKKDWCVRPTLFDDSHISMHECVKMNVSSKLDLPKHANMNLIKGEWVVEFCILL